MVFLIEIITTVQLSALGVRIIHFLALAAILGGALAVALPDRPSSMLARRYEYLFWIALGLVIVSGIGNVGLLGLVPDVDSRWGRMFLLKLVAILGLIIVSLVRLSFVVRTPTATPADRRWYLVTAGWVGLIIVIAVVMVRG